MRISHVSSRLATAFSLMLSMTAGVHAGTHGVVEAMSASPAPPSAPHAGFPLHYTPAVLNSLKPGDGFYATLVPGDRVRLVVASDQSMQDFHRLAGSIESADGVSVRGSFSVTMDHAGQAITGTVVIDDREYGLIGTNGEGYVDDMQLDNRALMHLE